METSSVSIGARRPPGIVRQIRREEQRRGVRSATRIRASGSKAEEYVVSDRTKRLLEGCTRSDRPTEGKLQAGGAGGGTTLEALKRVDGVWRSIRNMPEGDAAGPAPVFVTESSVRLDTNRCDYDVAVCGGRSGCCRHRTAGQGASGRGHRARSAAGTGPGVEHLALRAGIPRALGVPHRRSATR